MARATGNSFYRIFRDQNQLAVYAYQLFFDLSGNGSAVRVTAKQYDEGFMAQFPYADAGKPTPTLSEERSLGPLSSGQTADLDLFEIPGMGLHVGETIAMQLDNRRERGPLRFSGLAIAINGKTVSGSQQSKVSGRFVMFYVPGHGGYFFSVEDPGRGFVKAGSIDGRHMRFSVDNDDYECLADSPILTRSSTGELWVLHDPSYQPEGDWTTHPRSGSTRAAADQFFVAAADSLGWWLP